MNTLKLTAFAVALTLSAAAEASLFCRNDLGQTLEWKWGHARPNTAPAVFDVGPARNVVCFVNGYAETFGLPQTNVPRVAVSSPDSTAASAGLIYRGNWARWLIENLPAASGQAATLGDYNAITP